MTKPPPAVISFMYDAGVMSGLCKLLLTRHYSSSLSLRFFRAKKQNQRLTVITVSHWLCVCASGSFTIVNLSHRTSTRVSCLHFGQYSGKCTSIVSSRSFIRVFPLQMGHSSHDILAVTARLLVFSRITLSFRRFYDYAVRTTKPIITFS